MIGIYGNKERMGEWEKKEVFWGGIRYMVSGEYGFGLWCLREGGKCEVGRV